MIILRGVGFLMVVGFEHMQRYPPVLPAWALLVTQSIYSRPNFYHSGLLSGSLVRLAWVGQRCKLNIYWPVPLSHLDNGAIIRKAHPRGVAENIPILELQWGAIRSYTGDSKSTHPTPRSGMG